MKTKTSTRIPLTIDHKTLAKIDQIAKTERQFEGNRSLFIRKAIYEQIEKYEVVAGDKAA